jgi:hypothetical protein
MIDDYTPYDDIYLPLNKTTNYNILRRAVDGLIEELNEADKQEYDTHIARIELERIRNTLYKMNRIVMRIVKVQAKPWEKLGISKATYYYRRKLQFNEGSEQ